MELEQLTELILRDGWCHCSNCGGDDGRVLDSGLEVECLRCRTVDPVCTPDLVRRMYAAAQQGRLALS
jgi:hypothetical protein